MKNATIKDQFNLANSKGGLFESLYADKFNGLFTQVRGAKPILPL